MVPNSTAKAPGRAPPWRLPQPWCSLLLHGAELHQPLLLNAGASLIFAPLSRISAARPGRGLAGSRALLYAGDKLKLWVLCFLKWTLTQRKAVVTAAKVFSGMDLGDFLTLVASAEASSEHPLAKAILDYALHFHFFGKLPSSKDGIEQRKDKELLDNKVQTLEKEWSVVEEESLKKPTPGY
ncbi:Copper-transporting ATPase RAN1 [Zea mays]|uniref:Copper-transporting ATPase RAN1 n=1 Tax=Zea mays TaxID=4577 RepID=A0A3L6EGY6_MAIZE|nr:Copper-transporting ATPase RAN1 [Zea mays]